MDKESEAAARQGFVGNAAAGLKAAPCPICGTNCSGCLEDLAAKQEGLRELLSYCRIESNKVHSFVAADAYVDVINRLAPLLDGEE